MSLSTPNKPKKRSDELFDKFGEVAKQWLIDVPEARGLMLVVDWETGQNDFPPCTLLARDLNEHTTIEMMRQSLKLLIHLTKIFDDRLNRTDSIINLAKQVIQRQPNDSTNTDSA